MTKLQKQTEIRTNNKISKNKKQKLQKKTQGL